MSSWIAGLSDLAVRAVTMTGPETAWGYAPYIVLTVALLWLEYEFLLKEMQFAGPPPLFGGVQLPEVVVEEGGDDE